RGNGGAAKLARLRAARRGATLHRIDMATSPNAAPAAEPPPLPEHVILYDGVCGFCDSAVQWILDHEGDQRLHYAALQGETAARLRARYPNIPTHRETAVYIAHARAHPR